MPLPLVVGVAVRVGVAAAGKIIAKQAASAAAKKAAAAAAKKAAEDAAKKAAAQGLGRQAGTQATRDAAKQAAQKTLGSATKKPGGKGPANTVGKHNAKKANKKNKDPCKHERDKQKKKYVVYRAQEFDKNGNLLGTYVGRTSGKPTESVRKILNRRKSGHHREGLGDLDDLFVTDSYAAVRGAEQRFKERLGSAKQIQPIGDRNKRKQDYLDCAESKGVK